MGSDITAAVGNFWLAAVFQLMTKLTSVSYQLHHGNCVLWMQAHVLEAWQADAHLLESSCMPRPFQIQFVSHILQLVPCAAQFQFTIC